MGGKCVCPTDDCKMTSPKTLRQLLLFTADNIGRTEGLAMQSACGGTV